MCGRRVVCKLRCQRPRLTALPPRSCATPSELFPLFSCNLDLYLYLCAGIGVKLKQVMDGSTWHGAWHMVAFGELSYSCLCLEEGGGCMAEPSSLSYHQDEHSASWELGPKYSCSSLQQALGTFPFWAVRTGLPPGSPSWGEDAPHAWAGVRGHPIPAFRNPHLVHEPCVVCTPKSYLAAVASGKQGRGCCSPPALVGLQK